MADVKDEEEQLIVVDIPNNVEDGVDILGLFTVKLLSLAEGVAIAVVVVFALYLLLSVFINVLSNVSAVTFLVVIGIAVALGIAYGWNGDTLVAVVMHIIQFNQNRRICLYNPRIKKEAHPLNVLEDNAIITPHDRITEYMRQYREKRIQSNFNASSDLPEQLYFEDDEGYIDAPSNYISNKSKSKNRQNKQTKQVKKQRKSGKGRNDKKK